MPTKLVLTAAAVLLLIIALPGAGVAGVLSAIFGGSDTITLAKCSTPIADIPPDYCQLYVTAAPDCPGLPWTVLAAIGKAETDHGRSTLPGVRDGENSAGAGSPMQFLASTFAGVVAAHPLPAGGATPPSRYNPSDAIHAAAFLLCDNGARQGDLRAAVFAYNHDDRYVDKVLAQAALYTQAILGDTGDTGVGDCDAIQAPNPAALAAINYACGQRGLPYEWGGNGPSRGDTGFDCSGLTTAAYAAAGITLPRTADTQYHAGPRVPDGQPLLPGDLVFYGTPTKIHHVGLYLGGGLMIDAPDFGQVVKIEPYRYNGDDYAGATRPSN
ncbi:C40 family peptidase [Actinokineospora diospyrosa]|uniref:NlpC/P60 family protein n=1 Tax=Actinokineospora diospyrosa TaxID=103728 RepID=A0ABT1I9B6_9PSEU|nr:C40 family peptidase [Actinokineospora diospyrosa]MCP2269217.1 NlpC/P60 family protein [Actinokineospora diospyrosa]